MSYILDFTTFGILQREARRRGGENAGEDHDKDKDEDERRKDPPLFVFLVVVLLSGHHFQQRRSFPGRVYVLPRIYLIKKISARFIAIGNTSPAEALLPVTCMERCCREKGLI